MKNMNMNSICVKATLQGVYSAHNNNENFPYHFLPKA